MELGLAPKEIHDVIVQSVEEAWAKRDRTGQVSQEELFVLMLGSVASAVTQAISANNARIAEQLNRTGHPGGA